MFIIITLHFIVYQNVLFKPPGILTSVLCFILLASYHATRDAFIPAIAIISICGSDDAAPEPPSETDFSDLLALNFLALNNSYKEDIYGEKAKGLLGDEHLFGDAAWLAYVGGSAGEALVQNVLESQRKIKEDAKERKNSLFEEKFKFVEVEKDYLDIKVVGPPINPVEKEEILECENSTFGSWQYKV